MLARIKRQLVVSGARCAGGLLLLCAPLGTQAMAQGEKVYRPQMVAMLEQTAVSMASVNQELAVAQRRLAAIRPTMALLRRGGD